MSEGEPILMLRGERVGLGPIRRDLLETYQRWFNDLRVTRTLGVPMMPMTREAESDWLENALASRSDAAFTIYELATMRPIGNTGLHGINYEHGTATFGIVIGEPDAWNQGFGTETTRLVLQYGFDALGLHNIILEVYSNNPGGIRAYERAGFRRIGVRRAARVRGRTRADVILMDAIVDDFEPSEIHSLVLDGPVRDQ